MPVTTSDSEIACISGPVSGIDTDFCIVPWFVDEPPSAIPGLDAATAGEIGRALASNEFTGKLFDQCLTPIVDRTWRAGRLLLIGAGPAAEFGGETARKVATAGGLAARTKRAARAAFVMRGKGDVQQLAQAVAEGLTLSEFNG